MMLNPATLFLLLAPTVLMMPALGWMTLNGIKAPLRNYFYSGCTLLIISYLLVIYRDSIPFWASFYLGQFSLISGHALLISAQRLELGSIPVNRLLLMIVVIYTLIFALLIETVSEPVRLAFVFAVSMILQIWLFIDANKLRKLYTSKGYSFCTVAFALIFVVSGIRLAGILTGYGAQTVLDPQLDSFIYFLTVVFAIILLIFGFLGYMLERFHTRVEISEGKNQVAAVERDWALSRENLMTEVLAERDQTLRLISRASRIATVQSLSTSITHEITQPLTALNIDFQVFLDMIKDEKDSSPELLTAAERIDREIQQVIAVVQKVRTLINNQDIHLEAVLMHNALRSALEIIEREAEINSVKITDNCPATELWVYADNTLLLQVFLTILLNAVQALKTTTSHDRHIAVSTETEQGRTIIYFDDNGPGIPPEVRARVFDLFYTGRSEGTGIGLTICKSIMQRLDGTITLMPGPLGGERVVLSMQSCERPPRKVRGSPSAHADTATTRVRVPAEQTES